MLSKNGNYFSKELIQYINGTTNDGLRVRNYLEQYDIKNNTSSDNKYIKSRMLWLSSLYGITGDVVSDQVSVINLIENMHMSIYKHIMMLLPKVQDY
jgi:hypothetical protein